MARQIQTLATPTRMVAGTLLFAAGYFALGWVGYKLCFLLERISVIWIPAGVSVALLLIWGRKWWPGIFLGSFLFCLHLDFPLFSAAGIALANTLGVGVSVSLIRRFAAGYQAFEKAKTTLLFVLSGAAGTVITATIGTASLMLGGLAEWSGFFMIGLAWWLADLSSVILFGSFTLIWFAFPRPRWRLSQYLEGLGLLLTLFLLGLAIVCEVPAVLFSQIEWVLMIPLLWAALRLDRHWVISGALVIFALSVWGVGFRQDFFSAKSPEEGVLQLQLLIGVISVTALVLVAFIAEIKRSEIMARSSEERYRRLAESLPDAVYVLNARSEYLFVNSVGASWFHQTVEAIIGKRRNDFFPEAIVRRHQGILAQVVKTGEMAMLEWRAPLPIGERWLETRYVPLRLHPLEKVEFILGISRDMTEQKETERQLVEISAGERQRIGHDLHDGLGQHLSGVAFLAKALENDLSAAAPEQARSAAQIVGLLNQAISQTRTLSRLLAPTEVAASGLSAALVKLTAEFAELFRVETVFIPGAEDLPIDGEKSMVLYRIAQEAMHNALRHGAAKRIELSLFRENGEIALMIRDNGRGFSNNGGSSSGMGMRIMRHRAISVEGQISFQSSPERGVEVICRVPVK